jgi:NADPH:quinone reductase-like Zn-dependent oxidoreductase
MMLAMNYIGKIDFMPGMKILINGASGSIGSAGVQLARNFGAEITAVCDTRNVDLARSLGANKVIDYTREDFTRDSDTYDVVFDAVGKSSFFKCRKLLKPRGVYCSTELGFLMQNVFLSLVSAIPFGRKVIFPIPRVTKEDIVYFKDLIEAGKFRAVIDRRYPLERMVEAARYVETGLKAGSIVITM